MATESSVSNLESVVVWSALTASMLRFATPLIFAALGGMFSERSGVVNIGLEGMLLMGAFFGILGADKFDSWIAGVVLAAIAGGLLARDPRRALDPPARRPDPERHGGLVPRPSASPATCSSTSTDPRARPAASPRSRTSSSASSTDVPYFGDAFGEPQPDDLGRRSALVPLSYYVDLPDRVRPAPALGRASTREAAETVGLSVYRIRYTAVIISGVLGGLGGAFLSIGFVNSFSERMTAGAGFIALAALIFGNWRPKGLFLACLLFGSSSAIAQRLPVYSESLRDPLRGAARTSSP